MWLNQNNKSNFLRSISLHIVPLAIWHYLFLELWLVDTWFFVHPCDQHAKTRLGNVRQLNIRRSKKLGFQLSHTQPLCACNISRRNKTPLRHLIKKMERLKNFKNLCILTQNLMWTDLTQSVRKSLKNPLYLPKI